MLTITNWSICVSWKQVEVEINVRQRLQLINMNLQQYLNWSLSSSAMNAEVNDKSSQLVHLFPLIVITQVCLLMHM